MPLGNRIASRSLATGLLAALLLLGGDAASAQAAIPGVGPLTVASAVAGAQPTPVVNSATNYSTVIAFPGQKKIVAQLNANMPANVTLGVRVTGAASGTSLGTVNLGLAARDVVLATTPGFYTNVNITYTLTATVAAGVVPATTRTVTFTLLDYP